MSPSGWSHPRQEAGPFRSGRGALGERTGLRPRGFSQSGNATCPFCRTVAESSNYVKAEGCAKRMIQQMMAIVCVHPAKQGKTYLSADDFPDFVPDDRAIRKRAEETCAAAAFTLPDRAGTTTRLLHVQDTLVRPEDMGKPLQRPPVGYAYRRSLRPSDRASAEMKSAGIDPDRSRRIGHLSRRSYWTG